MTDIDAREAFPLVSEEEGEGPEIDFYEEKCPDDPPLNDGDYRWYKPLRGHIALEVFRDGDWNFAGIITHHRPKSSRWDIDLHYGQRVVAYSEESARKKLLTTYDAVGRDYTK